jgi:hypothetical protein
VHHLPSALEELKKESFDSGLVNIGIDQEKHGTEIADILTDMGVPFAFVTGYPALSGRHANVPLLQKPFSKNQLGELLDKLVVPTGAPQTNR